jgi:hypothetical protein
VTFGNSICWRDEVRDEDDSSDLVELINEVMHVDQIRSIGFGQGSER